jgi:hypothetical protein
MGQSGWSLRLTTQLYLVQRFRISGATPPLPTFHQGVERANLCWFLNDTSKWYIYSYSSLYYRQLKQTDKTVYSREFPLRIAAGERTILSQVSLSFS